MNQLRAELLKIRSTRTTIGLLLGLIALALLFTVLTCTLTPSPQLLTEQDQSSLLSFGSIAGVFAALAGVMLALPAAALNDTVLPPTVLPLASLNVTTR